MRIKELKFKSMAKKIESYNEEAIKDERILAAEN